MYARMQVSNEPISAGALAGAPGYAGAYALEQVGTDQRVLVSLWASEDDALAAPIDGSPAVHEVVGRYTGPAVQEAAAAATVLHFDGPQSEAQYRAAQFAFEHRLRQAMSAVPGAVRGFALWQPEYRSLTAVNLATSVDALEAIGKAVNGTELLPGEDIALLPGPDRVEFHRVLGGAA